MKLAGMICEFNPLHNGHKYALSKTYSLTHCDGVIALMSGNFTERGDIAILDKYSRAVHAIKGGADIVIELPLCYAISNAENFAYGGIKLLNSIPDAEYISFGSECGNIGSLTEFARLIHNEPKEVSDNLNILLKQGNSYPSALSMSIENYLKNNHIELDSTILKQPNNTLGIEYIRSLLKLNSTIKPFTYTRLGDDYNKNDINSIMPSATAIRQAVKNNNDVYNFVPDYVRNDLMMSHVFNEQLFELICYSIISKNDDELMNIVDMKEGLHNKFKKSVAISRNMEEFLFNIKSKRYTLARLKRIALYCLFNITINNYKDLVSCSPYYKVLAINKDKMFLLNSIKSSSFPIITKFKDTIDLDSNTKQSLEFDDKADRIYSLLSKKPVKTSMIIV